MPSVPLIVPTRVWLKHFQISHFNEEPKLLIFLEGNFCNEFDFWAKTSPNWSYQRYLGAPEVFTIYTSPSFRQTAMFSSCTITPEVVPVVDFFEVVSITSPGGLQLDRLPDNKWLDRANKFDQFHSKYLTSINLRGEVLRCVKTLNTGWTARGKLNPNCCFFTQLVHFCLLLVAMTV